jgi:hypothetical protein
MLSYLNFAVHGLGNWMELSYSYSLITHSCRVWVWNLVSHMRGRTQIDGVWKQGADEDILTKEGWSYISKTNFAYFTLTNFVNTLSVFIKGTSLLVRNSCQRASFLWKRETARQDTKLATMTSRNVDRLYYVCLWLTPEGTYWKLDGWNMPVSERKMGN